MDESKVIGSYTFKWRTGFQPVNHLPVHILPFHTKPTKIYTLNWNEFTPKRVIKQDLYSDPFTHYRRSAILALNKFNSSFLYAFIPVLQLSWQPLHYSLWPEHAVVHLLQGVAGHLFFQLCLLSQSLCHESWSLCLCLSPVSSECFHYEEWMKW